MQVNRTGFQRFTERVEHGGGKLSSLVEKENPTVREGRGPRNKHAGAAANERGHRHGVVRRLEWGSRHERHARGQ